LEERSEEDARQGESGADVDPVSTRLPQFNGRFVCPKICEKNC